MKKHEENSKNQVIIVRESAENSAPLPPLPLTTAQPRLCKRNDEKRETPVIESPRYRSVNIIRASGPLTPLYDSPLNAEPKPNIKISSLPSFDATPLATPPCIGLMTRAEPYRERKEVIDVGGVPGFKAPKNYINPYVLGINEKSSSPKYKR